jgi:hypothetical protein
VRPIPPPTICTEADWLIVSARSYSRSGKPCLTNFLRWTSTTPEPPGGEGGLGMLPLFPPRHASSGSENAEACYF